MTLINRFKRSYGTFRGVGRKNPLYQGHWVNLPKIK